MSTSDVEAAYKSIDHFHGLLEKIKAEAKQFNDLENLFELE